jgi:uncharacterized membrane protein YdbT with pleckstrin-like domain
VSQSVVIPKVWLSEVKTLLAFLASLFLVVYLYLKFPWLTISGDIYTTSTTRWILSLPLPIFIPCYFFFLTAFRIYNVRYTIDSLGIEYRTGVLWTSQNILRIRYEDIRTLELKQTLFDRLVGIGTIEIATAASSEVEIVMEGIAHVNDVMEMIGLERDRRQKIFTETTPHATA